MKYNDEIVIEWLKTARRNDICQFLVCEVCKKPVVDKTKHHIQIKNSTSYLEKRNRFCYVCCSASCASTLSSRYHKPVIVFCMTCNKKLVRKPSNIEPSGHTFCSKSCAGQYYNAHKTTGTRRSKLEIYLEEQLKIKYPNLEFVFNNKETIQSELDIYIPSLKLAFELNGIFHYEPIYGKDKLTSIQNNDDRKFQACLEQGIELCIIDSSKQKQVNEKSSKKYFDIIIEIINKKWSR